MLAKLLEELVSVKTGFQQAQAAAKAAADAMADHYASSSVEYRMVFALIDKNKNGHIQYLELLKAAAVVRRAVAERGSGGPGVLLSRFPTYRSRSPSPFASTAAKLA